MSLPKFLNDSGRHRVFMKGGCYFLWDMELGREWFNLGECSLEDALAYAELENKASP